MKGEFGDFCEGEALIKTGSIKGTGQSLHDDGFAVTKTKIIKR